MTSFLQNQGATISTVLFFLIFCYVIFSVLRKGQKQKFNHYSQIPLNDEDFQNNAKPKKKAAFRKRKPK
jgi:cbb3-type cytochrome oxidase subunit 3